MSHSASISEVAAALPWYFPSLALIIGACVGSFLNVVIYRVPAGKSVVTPGSHCACGTPIAWYDNVPVLSWFILRGRARCCGRPYSIRYAAIEALTAALFVACWFSFPPAKAAAGAMFLSILVAATFIDLDHMILPDGLTIGAGLVGVLASIFVPSLHGVHATTLLEAGIRSGVISVQGLLIASGMLLWIALLAEYVLKKEAMGFGDVKFIGMIGAFCGWQGAVFAIFGGAIVGVAWLALAFLWQRLTGTTAAIAPRAETAEGVPAQIGLGVHVPFGPMLAVAAALYFLFFEPATTAWFKSAGLAFA